MVKNKRLQWNILIAFAIYFCLLNSLNAEEFDDRVIKHIELPSWFKDSPFLELDDDLEKARANGKKGLMLFFTTEGCSYCDRFIRTSLANPVIASTIQKYFDSIGMEIFNDADITTPTGKVLSAKKFAKEEGVQFSPSIIFYDNSGKKILRLIGYQSPTRFKKILKYISSDSYITMTLQTYLKSKIDVEMPVLKTALKMEPFFKKPPYILEPGYRSEKKPLFVLFEKRACLECDYFHKAVLNLKEVRNKLEQFDVVRLDADDVKTPIITPDGKRISPSLWYEQAKFTRTPAILLFNEEGKEVLKTDALVMRLRMVNSLKYVLERAYDKGWTFQQFGREVGRAKARRERVNKGLGTEEL